jgi:hypothetical protein
MRSDLIPVMVVVIVAIVCTAGILFSDFGPSNDSEGSGSARPAATVSRVGAIEIPSEPPAGRQVPQAMSPHEGADSFA